jgi:hypothetical protein
MLHLRRERKLTFLDESSAGVEQGCRFLLAATEVYLIERGPLSGRSR